MKIIKQTNGAMELKLSGKNHLILNWSDNMMEIHRNGKLEFVIDMNNINS